MYANIIAGECLQHVAGFPIAGSQTTGLPISGKCHFFKLLGRCLHLQSIGNFSSADVKRHEVLISLKLDKDRYLYYLDSQ